MFARSSTEGTRVPAGMIPPTQIVPLRHPGRTASAVIVVLLAAGLGWSFLTNEGFGWSTVWEYLFNPKILDGLRTTLILTFSAESLGIIFGVVLAACRMSHNRVLSIVAGAYLWFFRGTPLLVQLVFWYNLSALYPTISIGIPFGGQEFWSGNTNDVLGLWLVAILGLTLNESAYMAEIVRGGLLSVARHQSEAASALGMSRWLTFTRIVLPQALRVIVPPTGNQAIGMLKSSALVSVIALADLLYSAQLIYAMNFQTIPLLVVVSLWYLVWTTVLSMIQSRIERHYGRGVHGSSASSPDPLKAILKFVGLGSKPGKAPSVG